ncbi:MAG: hypothetical protein ACFB2W_06045 [Leptolyngbyaceae cyanobacterium]
MSYTGFLDPNIDRLDDFIRSITTTFASHRIRLALWLIEEFDFSQFSATPIHRSASPFSGSNSQLAGVGYLLTVEANMVDALIEVLTAEEHLDCNIMHLELEVAGKVAIAAYDTFSCAFFNPPITTTFLETLKHQDIISDYGLC